MMPRDVNGDEVQIGKPLAGWFCSRVAALDYARRRGLLWMPGRRYFEWTWGDDGRRLTMAEVSR